MRRVDETKTMMVQTGRKASNVKHFKWILPTSMAIVAGGVPLGFGIYALANPTAQKDSKLIMQLQEFDKSIANEFTKVNIGGENYWMPNIDYIKYVTKGEDPVEPMLSHYLTKYPQFHDVIEPGTFEIIVNPGNGGENYRISSNSSTSKGLLGLGWDHKVSDFFKVDLPNYLESVSAAHPLPPKDPDQTGKPVPVDESQFNVNAQPDYTGQPLPLNITLYNPTAEQQLIDSLVHSEPQMPSDAAKIAAAQNEPRRDQYGTNEAAAIALFEQNNPQPTRELAQQHWVAAGHPQPTLATAEANWITSGHQKPQEPALPAEAMPFSQFQSALTQDAMNADVMGHLPPSWTYSRVASTDPGVGFEIRITERRDNGEKIHETTSNRESYILFLKNFQGSDSGTDTDNKIQGYGIALENYDRDMKVWNTSVQTQLTTDTRAWNTEIDTQLQNDLSAFNTAKSNWETNERATAKAADQQEFDDAHQVWQSAKDLAEQEYTDAVDEYNTLHPQWVRNLLSARIDYADKQAIYERDFALVQARNKEIADFRQAAEDKAARIRESETQRLLQAKDDYESAWASWLKTTSDMNRAYYAVIGDQITEVMFSADSPFTNNKALYSELVYMGIDAIFPGSLEVDVHTAYLNALGGDQITSMELDEFLNKFFADTFGVMDMVNGNPNMTFLEVPYVVGITDFSTISFEYKLAEAVEADGTENVNSALIIPGALVGSERYRSHILANSDLTYNEHYYEEIESAEGGN